MLPLVYHPGYSPPFPVKHRFVMRKFELLMRWVSENGYVGQNNVFTPTSAKYEDLIQVHHKDYLGALAAGPRFNPDWKAVGLPWSRALIDRTFISPNGTYLATKLAMQYGVACHLAGGTHHAFADRASGFCMLNDLAFAAVKLVNEGKKVLIIDLDVHQGDGTAAILASVPEAVVCSVHCVDNFPFEKQHSDYDIELPAGDGDEHYLAVLETVLANVLFDVDPDVVIYDAGVDVYQGDRLGKLNLSLAGIMKRDCMVLEACQALQIPVSTVIGGGYDHDHFALAARHGIIVQAAHSIFVK
ncbi:histone deacetylase family protein [Salinibius halmophilus]|uniref:histone deacetylase family protein n=1 Tax=Salinibius halmophilus TaxID=1853216 RepID=UPI000E664A76|nr:histone deacetylase [Salinibius halmophilus]